MFGDLVAQEAARISSNTISPFVIGATPFGSDSDSDAKRSSRKNSDQNNITHSEERGDDYSTDSQTSNEEDEASEQQQRSLKKQSLSTISAQRVVEFKVPRWYLENEQETEDCSCAQSNCSTCKDSMRIGMYSLRIRAKKILAYKKKQLRRRLQKPISKKFNGRSKIATQKLRVNGKFVKRDQLLQ